MLFSVLLIGAGEVDPLNKRKPSTFWITVDAACAEAAMDTARAEACNQDLLPATEQQKKQYTPLLCIYGQHEACAIEPCELDVDLPMFDPTQAHYEGWGLFNGRDIQRLDELPAEDDSARPGDPVFPSDAAALDHVIKRASAGSHYHHIALRFAAGVYTRKKPAQA